MPSTITLRFNRVPNVGESIILRPDMNDGFGPMIETFVARRVGAYQCTIASNVSSQRSFFTSVFRADYRNGGFISYQFLSDFESGSGLPTLRITVSNKENFFDSYIDNTNGALTVLGVSTTLPPNVPAVDNVSFTQGDSPCNEVKGSFSFSTGVDSLIIRDSLGTSIESPAIPSDITSYITSINLNKGSSYTIQVFKAGLSSTKSFTTPPKISIKSITKSFTPNGYTVTVNANGDIGTNGVMYQIENATPQNSPQFPGLLEGTYNFTILDAYGCVISQSYELIDDLSTTGSLDPYFELSELNSFHFAKREENKLYENYFNTLSFEESSYKPINFTHLINKSDIVTIQFRSTYETHTAKIVDQNNVENIIPVAKKSENINIFDARDAYLTYLGNNKTGIYFFGGKTYDPSTRVENGINIYDYSLPTFYDIDSFVKLGNLGWYQIIDIVFDEDLQSWVAVTNYRSNSFTVDQNIVVDINYNQLDYEVYEFTVDFSSYEGCYYLDLTFSGFDETVTYNSEVIEVAESFNKTFEIISSNTENNEINYNTGIKHIVRLKYLKPKTVSNKKDINVNRTDTKISHLNARLTDKFNFIFRPIPMAIVIKLTRVLALDRVFIDGVGYIAGDDYDFEPLGDSNLYKFTAIMTPNNKQFDSSSNRNVISNVEYEGGFVETQDGQGFIKLNP
ncbi:hypothetical protein [Aquimarina sp. AU119]|uniref:hypothetical protein n=1 Tax=Aquimarina sp. AU119 TaxID=2108528 RepID=UPI000D696C46|nr:hypothetical protein [Aquimarina sp. AU119]